MEGGSEVQRVCDILREIILLLGFFGQVLASLDVDGLTPQGRV